MSSDITASMAYSGSQLFHHDPLTTLDFFDSLRKNYPLESEKRLMLAVLEDAVECYQKYLTAANGKNESLFSDAEAWIFNRDEQSLFSFESICDNLGLAPEWLRFGLLKQKERMLASRRPKERIVLRITKGKRQRRGKRRAVARSRQPIACGRSR